MLYLKAANIEDIDAQWRFITALPEDENGFTNKNFGVSREEFETRVMVKYLDYAEGKNLEEGHVAATEYFLWDDDEIVGLFRLRHWLNDFLREHSGHIGYGVRKDKRGKGYATAGLRLLIEKAWEIIPEDEIYMSVYKSNPASLRVQQKCGAYIHHEDELHYYTRVKREMQGKM